MNKFAVTHLHHILLHLSHTLAAAAFHQIASHAQLLTI
jgi:hypothetical protein